MNKRVRLTRITRYDPLPRPALSHPEIAANTIELDELGDMPATLALRASRIGAKDFISPVTVNRLD
jgi:hypothetical protein